MWVQEHQQQPSEQEIQAAKADLRERFLEVLNWFPYNDAQVRMFGSTTVRGTMKAVDAFNFKNLVVNKLQTPIGIVEHASLRVRDTVYVEIDCKIPVVQQQAVKDQPKQVKTGDNNKRDNDNSQKDDEKKAEESGNSEFESFDDDAYMNRIDNDNQQQNMELEQQGPLAHEQQQIIQQKIDDEGFEDQQQMDVFESIDDNNGVESVGALSALNVPVDVAANVDNEHIDQGCSVGTSNVYDTKGGFIEKIRFTADQFFNQFS